MDDLNPYGVYVGDLFGETIEPFSTLADARSWLAKSVVKARWRKRDIRRVGPARFELLGAFNVHRIGLVT